MIKLNGELICAKIKSIADGKIILTDGEDVMNILFMEGLGMHLEADVEGRIDCFLSEVNARIDIDFNTSRLVIDGSNVENIKSIYLRTVKQGGDDE